MTRKKTLTKDAALLEALRSNLHLLGEIAMRYEVETQPKRPEDPPSISCPQDVYRLLGPEMAQLAQEQLRVLLLDTKNNVVGQRVVYQGNVSSAIVRPAEVLRPAVIEAVPSIIVSHNHPSADPTPSPEDAAITREDFPGGKAPGHRASGPCRPSAGRSSSASRSGASWPDGPRRPALTQGNRPCASPRHIHRKET